MNALKNRILLFCLEAFFVGVLNGENLTLPDGQIIDLPDPSSYKYHLHQTDMNDSIIRSYLLIEMRPNTALLCPKGYYIQRVSQELFVSLNVNTLSDETFKTHYSSYGERKEDEGSSACPTLYRCLGFQACLFKYGNEFCRKDAAPNLRKMLLVRLTCQRDSFPWLMRLTVNGFSGKLSKMRNQVLHMRYRSQLEEKAVRSQRDYLWTRIEEDFISEEDVFLAQCQISQGQRLQFRGDCHLQVLESNNITEKIWNILGRTRSADCRKELTNVFCAFQFNSNGTCIPEFLLEIDSNVDRMLNWRSLPRKGHRPQPSQRRFAAIAPELRPVRLAFVLMLHKDIPAAIQLLQMIWRKQHFYVIHLDKRAINSRKTLQRYLDENMTMRNIILLPVERSFSASWGSYEIIRAQLEGIEELLRFGIWDFVINLSGSDVPLRSIDDFAASLAPYRGSNFLPFAEARNRLPDEESGEERLLTQAFYSCDDYLFKVVDGVHMPEYDNLKMYNSPQWGVFSREFSEYIVDEKSRSHKINKYQFYLQTHVIPDESYISTLLMNSPFNSTLRRYPVHVSNEFIADNADHLCRHFTEADFCGQGPGIFEEKHQHELMSHAHRSFFARKFSGDLQDITRQFALGLSRNGYTEFVDTFLPKIFVKELSLLTLMHLVANDERFLGHDLHHRHTKNIRILPSLVPHHECCRSPVLTNLRKFTDHRIWMDVEFADGNDEESFGKLRVSYRPRLNGRFCYSDGHLKMAFISPWTRNLDDSNDEYARFGLQETMPFPYGSAGITSITLTLIFAHDNFSCSSKDVGGAPITIKMRQPSLDLIVRLVSPSGETFRITKETVHFFWSLPNATHQQKTVSEQPFFYVHTFSVNSRAQMRGGLWTLEMTEDLGSHNGNVYTIPFYLLEFEDEKQLEMQAADFSDLWQMEQMDLIPTEERTEFQPNDRNHTERMNTFGWLMYMILNFVTCHGGLLILLSACTFIHSMFCYPRIRHRYFFRYIVSFTIVAIAQALLLLKHC